VDDDIERDTHMVEAKAAAMQAVKMTMQAVAVAQP